MLIFYEMQLKTCCCQASSSITFYLALHLSWDAKGIYINKTHQEAFMMHKSKICMILPESHFWTQKLEPFSLDQASLLPDLCGTNEWYKLLFFFFSVKFAKPNSCQNPATGCCFQTALNSPSICLAVIVFWHNQKLHQPPRRIYSTTKSPDP